MNWPILIIITYVISLLLLALKAARTSKEEDRKRAVKQHYKFLRDADVKPEEYHHFDYLLPPRRTK